MELTKLEVDILGDLRGDSHELWEWYGFVKFHFPAFSVTELVEYGNELLHLWIQRGWLRISQSRKNPIILSNTDFLEELEKLKLDVIEPEKSLFLLALTNKAAADVEWLPKDLSF